MNNDNNSLNNDQSNDQSKPWTKRVFNWMYGETPKENLEAMNELIDQSDDDNKVPQINPFIKVDSPSSLDCSTEFSSTSDSNDTHLVTITRLNEKGGLGNVIKKLRLTGFKKEDDLTRFWMPDSNSKECYECNFKFSTIRRRHHCRICGQIFCSRCCSRKIDGDKVGYAANIKVRSCNYCFNAVNSIVIKSNNKQIKSQQESIDTDLESRLSNNTITNSSQQQLPKAFHDLFSGNEATTSNDLNKFRSPRRSVDETNIRRLSTNKQENKLQSTPYINEELTREKIDRHKKQLFISSEDPLGVLEPSWVKEIDQKESSHSFDNLNSESDSIEVVLNLEEDTNLLTGIERKINEQDYKKHFLNLDDNQKLINDDLNKQQFKQLDAIDNLIKNSAQSSSQLTFYSDDQEDDLINSISNLFNREEQENSDLEEDDKNFKCQFDNVYNNFFMKLALQLLKKEKLNSSWFPILKELTSEVTNNVKPDSDILEEMDIRKHVKIKTLTGGNKQDSKVINGVVFSKHVAHRKMRKEIDRPKILLLTCPIVFQQRQFQKFISLEKLFLQENNYLENLIEKIASFKPNIIIVDKIVSIKAQELLCKKKITVVYNVKPNILYKLSRLTGGEIVDSIDAQINCPKFGTCDSFYLKTFNNQTLMFFDGCKPDSGCTLLLRGSIFKDELKKIKKILQFLIFCDYNWKYEKEYLLCSSAFLTPLTLNEFEQYYDNTKLKEQKSKDENTSYDQLTQSNSTDNLDPLMNNNNGNMSTRSTCLTNDNQMTKENIINMCNFINDQILSISPFILFKLPYLLTSESNKCPIKQYISCKDLFNSIRFQEYVNFETKISLTVDDAPYKKEESFNEFKNNEIHQFLLNDLKLGANHEQTKTLQAFFRSSDTIKLDNRQPKLKLNDSDNEENENNNKTDLTDPFDILIHQLFPVLYCSYSLNTTQNPFCIQPVIMQMEFYVMNDFSLGTYLRRYCFTPNIKCECGNSSIDHINKFSHVNGSIYVRCKELNKKMKRPNSNDIITWSWCQICKSSSQSKILSKEALAISFGKFLQLKICSHHFRRNFCEPPCLNHSLFHDHFQYFAYQDMVASFKYYPVILKEIVLPSPKLSLKIEIATIDQLKKIEYPDLHKIGFQIMSKIFEQICAYQAESENHDNDLQFKLLFAAEVKNRFELKARLDELQELLVSEPQTLQLRLTIMNKFILLKQLISSFVNNWNCKLNEYEMNRKKEDRLSMVKSNTKFPRIHSLDVEHSNLNLASNNRLSAKSSSYTRQNSDQHPIIRELLEASIANENSSIDLNAKLDPPSNEPSLISREDIASLKIDDLSLKASLTSSREDLGAIKLDDENNQNRVDSREIITDQQHILEKLASIDRSGSSESISSIVFGCTPGIKAGLGLGNEIVLNSGSDRENYEVLHSTDTQMSEIAEEQQFIDDNLKEDNLEIKNQITSSKLESKLTNLQVQSNAINSLLRNTSSMNQKKEPIRQSVKSLINNFLSSSNNGLIIPDPFLHSQHYLLPMKEKLPILLDDNDIGSIIAYSLTTSDYERKLKEIQSNLNLNSIQKTRYNSTNLNNQNSISTLIDKEETNQFNLQFDASNTSLTVSGTQNQNLKENLLNDNIDVQFNDSTTNYYCCIHFASQFRKLRSEVLDTNLNTANLGLNLSISTSSKSSQYSHQASTQQSSTNQSNADTFNLDVEEAFIRTISQTVEWVAKGGKSKASFSKTLNDRFVIKVVRKADIQLFTQMGSSYFEYMYRAINECKPTLLAKIIGAYSVSWKDNVSNASMKKYVLVMENVFFNRIIKQKFDLKGSEKNRLAVTKTSDDVLLDENLTKIIRDNPFYLRNHSKLVLQEAIDNDSKFLCDLNVIDYSLLVGIDEERKELVVAIIDYIQTYTSMKKLETVIKSVGKVLPTVVDPISYRIRFQNKMDQYFLCLPDEWYDIRYDIN